MARMGRELAAGLGQLPEFSRPSLGSQKRRKPMRKIWNMKSEVLSLAARLDYLSCVLTVFSTILVGRKCWEGWVVAVVNSVIICVIGLRTAQWGFIPANLFCIALYGVNLRSWRKAEFSGGSPRG